MTEFILDLIAWGGYFGIFLLMALENIVPPVPSEVIMGLGGMAVARGDMSVVPLIAWGTAGSVVGNYFWYYIGRNIGYERFRPFVERNGRWLTMEWRDVEKIHRFFMKRGGWVIFVFRFMPTFRTVISLPAGMTRMPIWQFVIWTAAGSAIWNTVLDLCRHPARLAFRGTRSLCRAGRGGDVRRRSSSAMSGASLTWKPKG